MGLMAKSGYFASRCKGGLARRRKIAGRRHCLSGPFDGRSPSQKAVGCGSCEQGADTLTGYEGC